MTNNYIRVGYRGMMEFFFFDDQDQDQKNRARAEAEEALSKRAGEPVAVFKACGLPFPVVSQTAVVPFSGYLPTSLLRIPPN